MSEPKTVTLRVTDKAKITTSVDLGTGDIEAQLSLQIEGTSDALRKLTEVLRSPNGVEVTLRALQAELALEAEVK